ncbi:S8 family peptidase [Streptomyces sp. NBC_00536]|uniref:S8 family peptidase n=1 Tax=Streptomyces sp. NBC_00536 TaxID=2975769 RepID=UPI002E8158A0|nr:S8 family serine peptidase [Streptomyces sp. NBC_00536]WUC80277.1 S8 family peptidase [Streptomyces sp. NBC_00536]
MTTRTKLTLAATVTAALAFAAPLATASQSTAAPEPNPAPLLRAANPVAGQYIVTLDKMVDPAKAAEKLGLKPTFVYSKALNGFAVPLTPLQLTIVRNSLGVKTVEEDGKVSAPASAEGSAPRGPSSTWGLDRIDQKELPLDNSFTTQGNGAGVTAYILDSGIDYKHTEFGGPDNSRATFGFDAIKDGRNGQDCQGHGTHVAGTVAGKTYGVARKANLVSVRVLGCDGKGEWSGIIAGMDWVAKNAKQPAVMNASLGGDKSKAVNDAATAVSDAGVLPVVAAGNSSVDACGVSPASAARVLTIAATNKYDEETDFSNYGECVSLYAPGEAIVSAKLGGGSVSLNGTSMAAPHVAGVAVLYKQAHPKADAAEIAEWVDTESTKDVLKSVSKSSPNRFLFTAGL